MQNEQVWQLQDRSELAKRGFSVVINNDEKPEEKIEVMNEINKIGQRALYIQADVSDPDQVEEMIEREIRLRE